VSSKCRRLAMPVDDRAAALALMAAMFYEQARQGDK
jgi:hypothetical protein